MGGDTPEPFFAVGTWYSNFLPTTNEEVRQFLFGLEGAAGDRDLADAELSGIGARRDRRT